MSLNLTGLERSVSVRNQLKAGTYVNPEIDQLLEDTSQVQSEGVYYYCLLPQGWRFYGARGWKTDHYTLWTEKALPSVIANYFYTHPDLKGLELRGSTSYEALVGHYCGFPRGRVTVSGDGYVVLNGSNLPPSLTSAKGEVERFFGIVGRCRWEHYNHEQCSNLDKSKVRSRFGITEDWPSVEEV